MSEQAFNPREHLIQIKSGQSSKEYLPVQWRLVWFREKFPNGSIETEIIHLDLDRDTEEEVFVWNGEKRRSEKVTKHANGLVIFKATVKDGLGGAATGMKMEKAASFPDYLEKGETGAIGRALAAMGYGTQFTGDDLDERHRIVDSPVERPTVTANGGNAAVSMVAEASNGYAAKATPENDGAATEQQVSSIRKLCQSLSKPEPEDLSSISYLAAQTLIKQLSTEYRMSRRKAS